MIPNVTISLERVQGHGMQLVAKTVLTDDERFFYADNGSLMCETFDDDGNSTGFEVVELNQLKILYDRFEGWHDEVRYVAGLLQAAHAWSTIVGIM